MHNTGVLNARVLNAFIDQQNPKNTLLVKVWQRNVFACVTAWPKSDVVISLWEHVFNDWANLGADVLIFKSGLSFIS